jgi:hypothetical protein
LGTSVQAERSPRTAAPVIAPSGGRPRSRPHHRAQAREAAGPGSR